MKKFFVFLCLLATISILSAKAALPSQSEAGSSSFTTRTYDLRDFTNIDVSSVVKVIYKQGETYSVKLTGRTDLLEYMEVTSAGGQLKVGAKKTRKLDNLKKKDLPDGQHHFILELTAPCLENILLSGVSSFETGTMTTDFLYVRLEGVSKLKLGDLDTPSLKLSLSGCSEVHIGGAVCKEYGAEVRGSSKVDIRKLSADKIAATTINGASKATYPALAAKGKVTFNVGGASKVTASVTGSEVLELGCSGASKGDVTFKGGALRAFCTGASKIEAQLEAQSAYAHSDGASKIKLAGTADKVEVDHGGVAANVDTSRLNQY